ncbi:MAG: TolC family protein [Fuscovulum sp.]|nr:TolC family protein [Fuscovulum sp.]
MPACRVRGPGAGRGLPALALLSILGLAGCVDGGNPFASRSATNVADPAALAVPTMDGKGQVQSGLIDGLRQRRSVLPPGSSFAQVAQSVLAASADAAEAELRVARLSAKARSKNWLPSIGPDVSLTSLGSLAASLVLDQAIFDNGRRKAERAFAAADVEVAAVSLATDLNQRVYDGLKHYVEIQHANDLAAITDAALVRMRDFERIMTIRVEGGLSDGSEYRVIAQKLAEMEATLAQEREGAKTARAELAAMSAGSLDGLSGLTDLPADPGAPDPLSVLMAQGEAARTKAEVQMARAGLMPGLGAQASVDQDGGLDGGLSLDGEGLGFGRKDNLRALEETETVALRRIDEAEETAQRRIVALQREIDSLTAQQAQEAGVLGQMEANLNLFTEQYKAGRRSLIELVGQFETLVRLRRDHASLRHRIVMARLDIARERGVLVDGAAM